jgi:universal stress protein A
MNCIGVIMDEIKSILYPTDFSDCSAAALPHAKFLAGQLGVPLHVLYVQEEEYSEANHEVLLHRLQHYLEERGIDPKTHSVSVKFGSAVEEILKAAEESYAGIIVMGTHGRSGLSTVFLGSVTNQVIKSAPCPVYVVRKDMTKTERRAAGRSAVTV